RCRGRRGFHSIATPANAGALACPMHRQLHGDLKMLRKSLLVCGMLASLVYVGTDVLAAIRYPEYHIFTSRAISELMASGAPTERLVDPIFLLYGVLMLAFAVGVWMSSSRKR